MEDFLHSIKIRESILMSYFMKHLQRLVKFWLCRKKWEVDSNLCSLRRLKGAGCKEFYTNLFETSNVWQVLKVGVSSVL